jgi:glycerophosphoryl diester phosphodiesterase
MWQRQSQRSAQARLVAHRGGDAVGGGDLLEAARRLVELRVEMVEVDVRRTSDGELVIHHDEAVPGGALRDHTYDELSRGGARIPRLEDFLDIAAGHMALDLELKEPGYEAEVLSLCLAKIEPVDVVVTSFSDSVVATSKQLAPDVSAGLLVGRREPLSALLRDVFAFGRLEACRADFLAPHYRLLATGIARRAERRGIGLLLWTVNDPRLIDRYLRDRRVLGVVTDAIVQPRNVSEV